MRWVLWEMALHSQKRKSESLLWVVELVFSPAISTGRESLRLQNSVFRFPNKGSHCIAGRFS